MGQRRTLLGGIGALDTSKGGNNRAFYTNTSQITLDILNHCLTGSRACPGRWGGSPTPQSLCLSPAGCLEGHRSRIG